MPKRPSVPEISPQELARALEQGAPIQVLDVRAPARVAGGRIDLAADGRFHNIVGSRLLASRSPHEVGLDSDAPVAVVCGHGNSSRPVAAFLNEHGYQARSVKGGMAAWMLLALRRDLPPTPSLDRFYQLDRVGKGALGYVLVSDGEALIVDPARHAEPYLDAVADAGATVVAVADTHCHADYLSGGPALGRQLHVPYYLHPADAVFAYDGTPGRLAFEPVEDGGTIAVGRASVRVVHTPGHTEGSVTYVVDGRAAITGDFLFVASLGRPDLAGKAAEWTGALWRSLERAQREWTDELVVYPAHYADERERNADRSVGRAFGRLKTENPALGKADAATFADWVQSRTGTFPDAYRTIKAANVGLLEVDDIEAEELEVGKNECAIG